jgi:ribonuclease R
MARKIDTKAGPKQRRPRISAADQAAPAGALTRDAVLAVLERLRGEAEGPVGKREVSRALGLDSAGKIALKRILKELEGEGGFVRKGRAIHRAGHLPSVVLCDIVGRDNDGELLAEPAEWDEEHGAPPKILIPSPRKPRPGEPAAGVGQRALLKIEDNTDSGPPYLGRVVRVIERRAARVLGVYRKSGDGLARVVPVDKKRADRDLMVPEGAGRDAKDGDLVEVELRKEGRFGPSAAAVVCVVGSLKSEKAISLIAIHAHGIPDAFRPRTLEEAQAARPAKLTGRNDWRALPLVTIDPPDAKDHDDAVHAAPDDDPDNEGGHIVTVAIADVAYYVRPGSEMDREAEIRGNSVYFPDRVVPMLPERISNDLCSLRAHEDRPALAVRLVLDANGRKKRHSFHRVMMRSAAKLSYAQAQAAIDGRPDETTAPLLEPVLRPLWRAYEAAKKARDARQPLDLDLPERKILLKPDGSVDRVVVPERLDAHRLIEEFMIQANVAAAETLEQKRQLLIYRVHDEPSADKIKALNEFLASINLKLAQGQTLRPAQFNGVLARVKDTENETIVNEVVLRSQAQAEYSPENYGHFGLHLKRYAHFTSPIRRYADLIVHRALIAALGLGTDGLPPTSLDQLAEIAADISGAERRAMAAERETTDRLIAGFLSDKIGARFHGRVAGVIKAGLFVKLKDTGADGFIPAATLGRDYYAYDERTHALVGAATGETFRLGDDVEVRLLEAAPFAGALRFEMLSDGRAGRPLRGLDKKRKPGRDGPAGKRGRPSPKGRGRGRK